MVQHRYKMSVKIGTQRQRREKKKKNEDTCDDGVDPVLLLADTCNENQ